MCGPDYINCQDFELLDTRKAECEDSTIYYKGDSLICMHDIVISYKYKNQGTYVGGSGRAAFLAMSDDGGMHLIAEGDDLLIDD